MCSVVNKHKSSFDVYIGRGSIWGNPFPMAGEHMRDTVVLQYRQHLHQQIQAGEITIPQLTALDGKRLGCFCAPKACHGDVICSAVRWALEQ